MDEPTDIIPVTIRPYRVLSDGTLRLYADVDERHAQAAFALFGSPGTPGAIARLTPDAAQRRLRRETTTPYGAQAKALRLSGFFRRPEVWRAVGSDAEFLAWLRQQPCAAKGNGGCEGDVVAAHVRRVAEGFGTGHKGKTYCAVSLCHRHHDLQHRQGESALGGKEHLDKQRIKHVEQWAWQKLKADLGYEHWSEIQPSILLAWAEPLALAHYLPAEYRDA